MGKRSNRFNREAIDIDKLRLYARKGPGGPIYTVRRGSRAENANDASVAISFGPTMYVTNHSIAKQSSQDTLKYMERLFVLIIDIYFPLVT